MTEQNFDTITVQDISDRADVNRGTFYSHFYDKYELLEVVMREQFQEIISSRLPSSLPWNTEHLRILIHATLDFFTSSRYCHPPDSAQFQQMIQEELAAWILQWLRQGSEPPQSEKRIPLETIAMTMSWSIFGAGMDQRRRMLTASIEEITSDVLAILMKGVEQHLSSGFERSPS